MEVCVLTMRTNALLFYRYFATLIIYKTNTFPPEIAYRKFRLTLLTLIVEYV